MLRIEITADPRIQMDGGPALRAQVENAMDALGFSRQHALIPAVSGMTTDNGPELGNVDAAAPSGPAVSAAQTTSAPAAPSEEQAEPEKPRRTRRTKAEIDAEKAQAEAPQISANPEARVDPADAAQDAADEQAETAQETARPLNLDDVRTVLGHYVKKFGMDRAQAEGPEIMTAAVGKPTRKITDIPEDPAIIEKVVLAITEKLEA